MASINISCDECGTNKIIPMSDYDKSKSGKHFCSLRCRATHYNKLKIHVTANKVKKAICRDCSKQIIANKHSNKSRCKECCAAFVSPSKLARNIKINKLCSICNTVIFATPGTAYCNSCYSNKQSATGRKSAALQGDSRRSRNEMLLATYLEAYFGKDNILTNCNMFVDKNGYLWDADIILPTFKVAVHWNGNWHHKKITAKHSVEQVQARDKIKYNVITANNYRNYIIVDESSFSEEKVKKEFQSLLTYLEDTIVGPVGYDPTTYRL